jgi:3-methylcrotonyl-CoA carboxylase beta subunit
MMAVLESAIDVRSSEFADNRGAMMELLEKIRGVAVRMREGGGEAAQKRHLSRG